MRRLSDSKSTCGHLRWCSILWVAVLLLLAAAPARAGSGGPDAGGYSWRDTAEGVPAQPPGAFASTTNLMPAFEGDGLVTAIPLPPALFPAGFPFYGQRYNTVYLSTEGWLSFVDPLGNPVETPSPLPTAGTPDATVAMLWYSTLATEFPNNPGMGIGHYGPYDTWDAFGIFIRYFYLGSICDIEVVLFQSGTIRIIYHTLGASTTRTDSTVGIENESGTIGTELQHHGVRAPGFSLTASGYAVEFRRAGILDCSNPLPIACGQTRNETSPAPFTPQALLYDCAAQIWEGHERVFNFTNTLTQGVNFDLSTSLNQALFVLDDCTQSACLRGGSPRLEFPLLPPGTYQVVVDGRTAADDGPFGLSVECAGPIPELSCGVPEPGATSGLDGINGWSCSPSTLTGPEDLYSVTLPADGHLSVRLSGADPGLEVLIFDPAVFNMTSPTCIEGGSSSITMFNAPAGTYGIAVDGVNGASGNYTLEVGCGAQLECDPGLALTCGQPTLASGSTRGLTPRVDHYDCGSADLFDGPEEAHTLTVTQPSLVYAELLTNTPDLEALFVTGCDEGDCMPASGPCLGPIDPGEYQVVVDGRNGAEGDYDLNLWCFEPERFSPWFNCEGGTMPPSTTQSTIWQFYTEGNYCPDGCDFAMYVVVECGQEFHLPFWDVESGHIRIYDILNQQYMQLEAENNVPATSPNHVLLTGDDIQWISDGCPGQPPDPFCPDPFPGGCDERYNNRVMDVRFFGTPSVCGVYRMELLSWGGFAWDLFANCTGSNAPGFNIYSDMCNALAAWNALPELQMTDVVVTSFVDCPVSADIEITLLNTGCEAAVDIPVRIENSTGDPPQFLDIPFIGPGEEIVVPVTVGPFSGQPADVTVLLDPGTPGAVFECNEAGSNPVTCSPPANVSHEFELEACPLGCTATAGAGDPSNTICQGEPLTLDASNSRMTGCLGELQYRWEAIGDPAQTRDWDTDPTYRVTPEASTIYRLLVRCSTDLTCMSEAFTEVVVTPNVAPPRLTNPVRGLKALPDDIIWSFTPPSDTSAASTRIYSSIDRSVSEVTRGLITELPISRTTHREVGGLRTNPRVLYYQFVAVSCAGDLESPY